MDYLNTVPLAAVPGYGEVHGLGAGLRVWFGLSLAQVCEDLVTPDLTVAKVHSFKQSLALIVALRAPTQYLVKDRVALLKRVNAYTQLLLRAGGIVPAFAHTMQNAPLTFVTLYPEDAPSSENSK